MTKIQNYKPIYDVLVIEYWDLGFICNLMLVFWNLYNWVLAYKPAKNPHAK